MPVPAIIALVNGLVALAINLAESVSDEEELSVEARAALKARRTEALQGIDNMTP